MRVSSDKKKYMRDSLEFDDDYFKKAQQHNQEFELDDQYEFLEKIQEEYETNNGSEELGNKETQSMNSNRDDSNYNTRPTMQLRHVNDSYQSGQTT